MWYVGILQPCKTTRERYLKAKEEDVFQNPIQSLSTSINTIYMLIGIRLYI